MHVPLGRLVWCGGPAQRAALVRVHLWVTLICILAYKRTSRTCMPAQGRPAAQSPVHAGRRSISALACVNMRVCEDVLGFIGYGQQCIYIPWPLCTCVYIHVCVCVRGDIHALVYRLQPEEAQGERC